MKMENQIIIYQIFFSLFLSQFFEVVLFLANCLLLLFFFSPLLRQFFWIFNQSDNELKSDSSWFIHSKMRGEEKGETERKNEKNNNNNSSFANHT